MLRKIILVRSILNQQERHKKWIKISNIFSSLENFLIFPIQGLGKLDLQLNEIDNKILDDIRKDKKNNIFSSIELENAFTLSYLWVLGLYEVLRTVTQRIKNEKVTVQIDVEKIQELKKLLESIRIPLAKMEKPWKHKNNPDFSSIAYPSLDKKRGIAWNIGKNKFISRRELSDAFVNLLDMQTTTISKT